MWENSDRNIQVYKKIVVNENEALWRKKKVSQIGYLNDFYIVYDGQSKDNSEQYSDNFEEIFNKTFENRLGRILKKIDDGRDLENKDWTTLFKFISVQRYKTLDGYLRIQQLSTDKMEEIIPNVIKNLEQGILAGELSSTEPIVNANKIALPLDVELGAKREGNIDLKVSFVSGRNCWLNQLIRLMDRLYISLEKHSWSLVKAPLNKEWITSDNPVITLNYYNKDHYDFNGGYDSPNAHIIVPISPKYLLFTQIGVKSEPVWQADMEFYEKIIKFICENATISIFSRNENKLVEKYSKRKVNDKINNLGRTLFEEYQEKEVPVLKKNYENMAERK